MHEPGEVGGLGSGAEQPVCFWEEVQYGGGVGALLGAPSEGSSGLVQVDGEDAGPATRTALQDHPEPLGLVIHNDALAIDAVPVLRESRREPGVDVALVSYDNTYLALREEFSLTSVDQPEGLLGERAVDLVCRRAGLTPDDGPQTGTDTGTEARSVVLEPQLITRASSLGR